MKSASAPDAYAGPAHSPDTLPSDNGRKRFSFLHSSFSIRNSAWGLLAGLAGSLCCLGPSAAVLLGLGSSSALFGLQLERPLAFGIGAALLLVGLAFALRRERACAVRPLAARWRQPALLLASFALVYGLLGLLAPWAAAQGEETVVAAVVLPASSAADLPQASSESRRATLLIEKMVCPPCAANVRSLLKRKAFVQGFMAEEGNETVVIDYNPQQIDARQLVKLFPLSFKVKLLSDDPLS
jgi:hypothetical protein